MHIAITGAATGIGAAAVAQLKAANHQITAFDILEPNGVDTWIPIDMSDMDEIARVCASIDGPFDALINNAGVPPLVDNAEKILAINTMGLIRLTNVLESKLTGSAAIVSTASRAGQAWRENIDEAKALLALDDPADLPAFIDQHKIDATRAYNLSKEAIIVWNIAQTKRWLTKGIRGNTVSPAAVDTKILQDFKSAFGPKVDVAVSRVGRAGSASEIAAAIVFLTQAKSHWIKGQDIVLDGGMTALAISDALDL